MGKSNLLEAIHFLCLARGITSMPESAFIRHGADLFSIKGKFRSDTEMDEIVSAGFIRGKGKSIKRNGKEYPRISEHFGAFPIVCVTPTDSIIVSGSAEERRKLMDMVISQADSSYLARLIRYSRALESRNKMLRAGMRDNLLFESVETVMTETSSEIHSARQEWVNLISPLLSRYYAIIAGNDESASIKYSSILNEIPLPEVLAASRAKDLALGFTSKGIHRDDIATGLGDYSMRRLGSQGQIKSFTLALRLAIFDFLRSAKGKTPILLLDDIFDKLDAGRVMHILKLVSENDSFGQIFITDTNRSHIDSLLSDLSGNPKLFEVTHGTFKSFNLQSRR